MDGKRLPVVKGYQNEDKKKRWQIIKPLSDGREQKGKKNK